MSTHDNSISLAVELAFALIPGVCHTSEEEYEVWRVADEVDTYETFGALLEERRADPKWQANPRRLLGVLLGTAAYGAGISPDELRRFAMRRALKGK